jgi:membrane protein
VNRVSSALGRLHASRAWRAWRRYTDVRGRVLAGGVAFFAFFSLIPALALGFTLFGLVVGEDNPDLQGRVVDAVNDTFGATVIGAREGEGVVTLDRLVQDDVLTAVGLVGVVVLLLSGLGWIGALREGLSAVFGRREAPNPLLAKAVDLGMLAIFGLSVLGSAVGSVLVTATIGPVLDWLGTGRSRVAAVLVSMASALVLLVLDTLLLLLVFRTLSGVRLDRDDAFTGALVGAVGIGLLKLGGGALLGFASGNQFLAAFSIVVGLLIWMSLASRVTLLAGALAATTAADRGHLAGGEPAPESPVPAVGTTPAPLVVVPTYSQPAADRVTLVAGAVLGATATVAVGVLSRAVHVLRGSPDGRRDGWRDGGAVS